LENGVKIHKKAGVDSTKAATMAGIAVGIYAGLIGTPKNAFDTNITEIHIVSGDYTKTVRRGTILELGYDTEQVFVQLFFENSSSIPMAKIKPMNDVARRTYLAWEKTNARNANSGKVPDTTSSV